MVTRSKQLLQILRNSCGCLRLFILILMAYGCQSIGAVELANSFAVRVGVRFLTPESVELRWESSIAGNASVAFGPTHKLGRIVQSSESGASHRVVLDGLQTNQSYHYRIAVRSEGKRYFSPFYEFDGRVNYSPPIVQSPTSQPHGLQSLIDELTQPGGYAVIVGQRSETWAVSLAARTTMTVVAICDDPQILDDLRTKWYAQGIYGIRLSAQLRDEVPAGFANLVVCDSASLIDTKRLLSPSGIVVCLDPHPDSAEFAWTELDEGVWYGQKKAYPKLSEWGHQYGSAANASYVGETLNGVDDTSELEIRWLGRPGADFGIDRNPRMPAPLAVGGRLFHQGMNRMIALDAFNGAVLWSLEIPDLRRVNIPRDSANWCADQQHVYAATRDCLWVIDAATGEMIKMMRLPESIGQGADAAFDWGYVAVTDDSIVGTAVKGGSAYQDYWSKAAWYDGNDDAATAKVCGDALIAYDKKYGDVRWQRQVDAVVQSTITIAGDRLYFVEVFDPSLRNLKTGKLTNPQIWKNASVICLDLRTGQEHWRKRVSAQPDDQIVAFGVADENQFLLETSGDEQFHFVSLDSNSGEERWKRSVKWPSDNHGAHMQHAVLMHGKLYVQPHIVDASDGHVLKTDTLGKRRGCATPIGAGNSIIYRGGTGPLSLWSLERDQASEFSRLRPSCWLSTIPAQGMLFSPEAGGGCSCGGWMECSIGFAPVVRSTESRP